MNRRAVVQRGSGVYLTRSAPDVPMRDAQLEAARRPFGSVLKALIGLDAT